MESAKGKEWKLLLFCFMFFFLLLLQVGASIKRTHSCASADGMKSSNFSEWVTENDNLNEVLQELAQFNLEQTPNDGNTTTATDTGVETADNKLDILAVLDEPVLNMARKNFVAEKY